MCVLLSRGPETRNWFSCCTAARGSISNSANPALISSAGASKAVERRSAALKLDACLTDIHDKQAALEEFLERHNTVPRRLAFIGDDLPDLVVLSLSGLSFAPADAVPEVRTVVHRVLEAGGGHGAVREMVEIILRARGVWDEIFSRYTFDG